MKKKTKTILHILLFILLIPSCSKSTDNTCKYVAIPNSLVIRITKSGVIIPYLSLLNVKLSYFENNEKKYVSDFSPDSVNLNLRDNGYIATRQIGILSAKNNIKTYYIEYSNGWENDTIYVDYLPNTPENNCVYSLNPLKVNDILATIYTTPDFGGTKVYEINKP